MHEMCERTLPKRVKTGKKENCRERVNCWVKLGNNDGISDENKLPN
jgi:hypothetical protein